MIFLIGLMAVNTVSVGAQAADDRSSLKENTLYQESAGTISGEAGEFFFPGNEEPAKIQRVVTGFSCYPNPFNEQTTLRYRVLNTSEINIKIFNILGQEIITLVDEFQDRGEKTVILNLTGTSDTYGGPGVYYAILTTGFERQVIKLFRAR